MSVLGIQPFDTTTDMKGRTVTYLVTSEKDVGALQETRAEQVAQGMVFLVEGEDSRRGDT